MGFNIGSVFLELLADGARLKADIEKQATSAADAAGAKAGTTLGASMSKGLQSVGKQLQSTGSAMTRSLTLPIVGLGAAIVTAGVDFDTTLRQITALTDATAQETDDLRGKILDLANVVGKDPTELAHGYYFLRSAGLDAAKAFDTLTVSAKLSASGMGDTADISRVLGASLNAFASQGLTATDAADQLLRAVKDGAAEASDFAGALGQVLPIAGAMGATFSDTAGAIAAMTLSGQDADTAATNLSQIMTALLKPTSEANDTLASLGLSAQGLREELKQKGLLAVLQTLQTAFEGNDTAASAVFGNVRALRGVLALLNNDGTQTASVLNDVANGTANAGEAFAETDGPGRQLNQALTEIKTALIDLSTDVLPPVVELLHAAAGFVHGLAAVFKALPGPVRTGIVQIAGLAAALGPLLFITGKLTSGFGVLFGLFDKLGKKLGPRIVASLAADVEGATATRALGTALGNALLRIPGVAALKSAIASVGSALGLSLAGAIGIGLAAAGGVAIALGFKALFLDPGLQRQTRDIGESVGNEIMNGTTAALEKSKAALEKGIRDIQAMPLGDFLYGDQIAALQQQLDAVDAELQARAINMGHEVPAGVASAFDHGEATVTAGAKSMMSGVPGAIQSQTPVAKKSAADLVSGIADGILSRQNRLSSALDALRNLIANHLTRQQRIGQTIGILIGKDLHDGLTSGAGHVREAAEIVRAAGEDRLVKLIQSGGKVGRKTMEELRNKMHDKDPAVRAAAQRVYDIVTGKFQAIPPQAAKAGTQTATAYTSALKRGLAGIKVSVDFSTSSYGTTGKHHKAAGGPVLAHKPYIVGEKGYELFVPDVSGRILSHAETLRAATTGSNLAGGDTYNIPVNITGVLAARTPDDVARPMRELARSGVITNPRKRQKVEMPSVQ